MTKECLREKKPQQLSDDSNNAKLAKEATSVENDTPKATQYPQEKSIIHCPTSMVLLFILFVEALAITAMQGCIIYYHTLVFAQCVFSLRTLGLSQVDLIYHGILIMAFVLIFQDTVDENVSNIKPFEYAILVLVPICFVVMAGCIVKLYSLFKWNHYKSHTLSPSAAGNSGDDDDTRLRTTLMAWSILTGLLKLDFFFLFAYAAQLVPSSMMEYTVPPYESVVVFCASVLAFLLATQGTRTENIKAMWLFSLVLLGSVGYLGYRLFTFGIPRDVTRDPYLVNVIAMYTQLYCIGR
ncbi:hypothetical protein MUCCIDRAFT_81648 [Mucor lusitanicus CBS 277.49]|uniref:Uncharacterized protein n=1 Tax=Mucor lusitanicus CBS 277.49 TaxID=747725 RepID=A0A168LL65_MUCCL|nr:hypothetical protein MUCCIDRAFT_81648 [Mucor lusitanicus CBS 277.49]